MAEIYIQKKSKSAVWLLVPGILALVIVAVWLIGGKNNDAITQADQTGYAAKVQANRPVALKPKSMTQVPGIVSLKLETYLA
jgi:hypothetical protein